MVGRGWEGEWEEGGGRVSGRKGVGGGKTVINILCLYSGWGEGGGNIAYHYQPIF